MDVRVIRVETGAVVQEYDTLGNGPISAQFLATPGPGVATYKIQVRCNSALTTGGKVFNRSLVAQVAKR